MDPHPKLSDFLGAFPESIQEQFFDLRNFILAEAPPCNELIWDNYNALAIAYSHSDKLKDAFCHLSVYPKTVNVGFNRGAELSQGLVKLEGSGKLIRHIKVKGMTSFPESAIAELVKEAAALSLSLNPDLAADRKLAQSLVMSISAKKQR